MFSVGEFLKRARQEQGLDLASVSARTKITASYLAAIESDDRKKFPSGFFYKSFVDQYAKALSLDTTEIDAELDRILAAEAPLPLPGQDENPIQRTAPLVVRNRRRWPLAFVAGFLVAVFGCSAVYALWHDGRLPIELPQVLALTKASPLVEAPKQPEVTPRRDSEQPTPVSLATNTEQETVSAAPVVEPAPASKTRLSLDLIATEKTWLSVTSDGKRVFAGVLSPKQTKQIIGKESAKLTVGNAGGLKVRLNGKSLGRLGAHGQVLVVLFTRDNFQIVSPSKDGD